MAEGAAPGRLAMVQRYTSQDTSSGFHRGSIAQVSQGSVNYRMWGRGDGVRPLVVTIHGLLGSMGTFASMAQQLLELGFDVLTFDLFGFGLSDSPSARFNAELYAEQTVELLSQIGFPASSGFFLAGYSMGGLVAMEVANRHPGRVQRLFLIAPAGLLALSRRQRSGLCALRAARVLRLPVVSLAAKLTDLWDWDTESFEPDMSPGVEATECARVNERRFRSNPEKYTTAWLKSVRDMKLGSSRKAYARAAATGVEVMFVWGDSDAVVPLEDVQEELREYFPTAPVAVLSGVGHGILIEHNDAVSQMAASWFHHGRHGLAAMSMVAAAAGA